MHAAWLGLKEKMQISGTIFQTVQKQQQDRKFENSMTSHLEPGRHGEGAVHPTITSQSLSADSSCRKIALDRFPEELVGRQKGGGSEQNDGRHLQII